MPTPKEYKRRQQLLKEAGYNVPTDGSWGKWQEQQWKNYLKDQHPVASFIADNIAQPVANFIGNTIQNAAESFRPMREAAKNKEYYRLPLTTFNGMVGAAFSPVTTIVSNIPIIKNTLPYLDLTKTSNLLDRRFYTDPNHKYLEHDYSEWSPAFNDVVQTTQIVAPVKYAKGVNTRGKQLNTKYATKSQVKEAVAPVLDAVQRDKQNNRYLINSRLNYDMSKGDRLVGPVVALEKDHPNAELHINPDMTFANETFTIHPETAPYIKRLSAQVWNRLPSNTVLTSYSQDLTKSQYLQTLPKWKQAFYKYTGYAKKPSKQHSESFSTDILENMQHMQSKGRGHVEYAHNGYIDGLNAFGLRFNNWAKYFAKPDNEFNVFFRDMAPEQVAGFNKAQNLIHIDPKTRTALKPVFITK